MCGLLMWQTVVLFSAKITRYLPRRFCRSSKKPLKSILKNSKDKGHHKKKKDMEPVFWSKSYERSKQGKEAIALANRSFGKTFVEVVNDHRSPVSPTFSSGRERKHSESSSQDKTSPGDAAFDSSKKPKKGILKKKYVGADSGCVLDDINISEYFNSDKNEKLWKRRSSNTKVPSNVASGGRRGSTSEGAEHPHKVPEIEGALAGVNINQDSALESKNKKLTSNDKEKSASKEKGKSPTRTGNDRDRSSLSPPSPLKSSGATGTRHSRSKSHDSSKEPRSQKDSVGSKSPGTHVSRGSKNASTPVSRKIKGILKRNGKFSSSSSSSDRDPSWRHSLGSQSSNSSGDLLDFSYDSTDDSRLSSSLPNPTWNTPSFNQPVSGDDEGYTELSVYSGDTSRNSEYQDSDDITSKINMMDETYFEEGIHRSAVSADLFNPHEARMVYKQAVAIYNKYS